MTWIDGPRTNIERLQRAMARALELPRAPSHVGPTCRPLVPRAYVPGALGWTVDAVEIADSEDGTRAAIEVPEELAASLQGRVVDVDGAQVVLDFRGGRPWPRAEFLRTAGDDDTVRRRTAWSWMNT